MGSNEMAFEGEKVSVPEGRYVPSDRVMGLRTFRWNVTFDGDKLSVKYENIEKR